MIAAVLVLVLVLGREVARAQDPDGPVIVLTNRLLVPAGIGLGVLIALRLADLVVGRA